MLSAVAARKAAKAAAVAAATVALPVVDAVASSLSAASPPAPEGKGAGQDGTPLTPASSSEEDTPDSTPVAPKKRKRKPVIPEQKPRKKRKPSPVGGVDDENRPVFTATGANAERAYSPGVPVGMEDETDLRIEGEEDEVVSDVDELPEPAPLPQRIIPHVSASTFVPSSTILFSLSTSEKAELGLSDAPAALLALRAGETIAFTGTCRLLVCQGAVEILGTAVHAGPRNYPIYAPKSHAVPVLAALPPSTSSASSSTSLPSSLAERISAKDADALIVLQSFQSGVEGLSNIVSPFESIFSPSPSMTEDWGMPGFHPITHDTDMLQPFALPNSWDRAMDAFLPGPRDPLEETLKSRIALIRGVKNSGKSTFARTLLNRLTTHYQRVAFLELDIGQSEFTPPGLVSLHILSGPVLGPAFTHPHPAYKSHYIGSSSPRADPAYYLACIDALLQSFKLDIQFIPADIDSSAPTTEDKRISDVVPLVVNSMGWTKGLGARLMEQIEALIQPTHLFEFCDVDAAGHPVDTFQPSASLLPRPGQGQGERKVYALEPVPPSPRLAQYSAPLLRALSTMSYLHSLPASDLANEVKWSTTLPLCAIRPWEVDPLTAFTQVVLIGPGAEDVVPSEIGTVLNAALVAFVALDESVEAPPPHHSRGAIPYEQRAPPPSPFTSSCLGLGVVRSFLPKEGKLHILTPLPLSQLAKCKVLIKGELELPIWGFLDHRQPSEDGSPGGGTGRASGGGVAGVREAEVPYLDWAGARGVGGERGRVRRNLMRRHI